MMIKKQTNLLLLMLVLLMGFQQDNIGGPGGIAFVRAQTDEPSAASGSKSPGNGNNKLKKCYLDVRDTCNCGLVHRGSRCVQNTIRQICRPKKDDRATYKRRIRKRYKFWCRKQFKRVRKVGIGGRKGARYGTNGNI